MTLRHEFIVDQIQMVLAMDPERRNEYQREMLQEYGNESPSYIFVRDLVSFVTKYS